MAHSTNLKKIIVFILTLGLLSAGPVVAQNEHEGKVDSIRLHLSRAKQSLAETVLKNEQADIKILEAELDDIDNFLGFGEETVVYKLMTIQDGEILKQFINTKSGKVQDNKKLSLVSFFGDDYKKIDFDTLKMTMSQAIKLAEEDSEGEAFKAELDERDDIWCYQVSTVGANGITRYLVDPLTGKLFEQFVNHEKNDRS